MKTQKRFADHVSVIKEIELNRGSTLSLVCSVSMSYFSPSGKARLSTKRDYSIYRVTGNHADFSMSCKTKAEGVKALRVEAERLDLAWSQRVIKWECPNCEESTMPAIDDPDSPCIECLISQAESMCEGER